MMILAMIYLAGLAFLTTWYRFSEEITEFLDDVLLELSYKGKFKIHLFALYPLIFAIVLVERIIDLYSDLRSHSTN